MKEPVLQCWDLSVTYPGGGRAMRGLGLEIGAGERVAVVGESGCGKSTLVRAVLGLLPRGSRIDGAISLPGIANLAELDARRLRALRGRVVGYVPQNPAAAFDPLRSVGSQIREAWRCHGRDVPAAELAERLAAVGIADGPELSRRRPAAWSGGMLQRAAIVAATALRPPLVLADEPTSAIDADLSQVTLRYLVANSDALLVVTHDIDQVHGIVDRVVVMYAGRIVEDRPARDLFAHPRHPYTRALLGALPRPGVLPAELPGDPPSPMDPDAGCPFAPRCSLAMPACAAPPPMVEGVACWAIAGSLGRATGTGGRTEGP